MLLDEVIGRLRALKQTPESQAVLDAIASGDLKVLLDPALQQGGEAVSGLAGSADSITLNSAMRLDDVVTTLVHEGKHALDMAKGVIPLPGRATLQDRALAEWRGVHAEIAFAVETTSRPLAPSQTGAALTGQ